jgi:drug/metabolite transporter (DMT)-like permease
LSPDVLTVGNMGFDWTQERVGAALCLVAAASFAVQPLLVKLAFDGGASVVSVGALRFALAAAVLAALARRTLAVTSLRILLPPFVLGLTLYGLETGLFFASIERIDVSLASLLMCSYPAIVVAGAVLLGRERASKRRVAALVVALAGVLLALAGGVGGALDPVGIALALAASVIYASYVLVSDRLLGTTEPLVLATMLCAGAATAFALGGAATGSLAVALPPTGLLLVAAIAILATVLPIAAFLGGVRRLGPSRATIPGTIEPPLTIGLSALVFGERLTPVQLLGAVLVVSAIVIVQARVRTKPQAVPVALPAPVPTPEPELLAA